MKPWDMQWPEDVWHEILTVQASIHLIVDYNLQVIIKSLFTKSKYIATDLH